MTDDPCPNDSLARDLNADLSRAISRVDEEFRSRLVRLGGRLLDGRVRGTVEGEDIAQSVFKSFFRRQSVEPYPIATRADLWHLLAEITRRKCVRAARRELAQKRGGSRRAEAPDPDGAGEWNLADPDAVPAEAVAVMRDLYQQLVAQLDELHRSVCELRLDGLELSEIAERLGVSTRTVERRMARVRERLESLCTEDGP